MIKQGLHGDGTKGLRAGQKAVMEDTPCHGDVFHILQQFREFIQSLTRKVQGAISSRLEQEEDIARAKLAQGVNRSMTSKLVHLKRREKRLLALVKSDFNGHSLT